MTPKSARVRSRDLWAAVRLAGECRDLGDDPTVWREHWFAGVAALAGAGLVLGGEKGGLRTGPGRTLGTAAWGFQHGFNPVGWEQVVAAYDRDPDYSPAEGRFLDRGPAAGETTLARTDVMPDRDWYRGPDFQDFGRGIGVDHLVWSYHPVGDPAADEVSAAVLCRAVGEADFTPRQKAVVRAAHALVGPLVGGPLARFADPAPSALPPRVRQVLKCLLEGDSDKQAAARLGLTAGTVNWYTKGVYRHFGVQTRAELLARWVRRGWGSRCAWADAPG
jgi:DNA-binding CsgD family transcriptional regulator